MAKFKFSKIQNFLNEALTAKSSAAALWSKSALSNNSVMPEDMLSHALLGNGRGNTLLGSNSKTVFFGAGGDDTIIGKSSAVNTAVYAFAMDKYKIITTRDGFTVKALVGSEGTDVLKNVSQLMFAGQLYTVEATHRGQPAKLTLVKPAEEPIPNEPDPTDPTDPTPPGETTKVTITSGATAPAIRENVSPNSAVYNTTAEAQTETSAGARAAVFATTAVGTITYGLKAGVGDASAFTIDPTTGVVTLKGSPNFEGKPTYTFTVVATDSAGNSDEQSVTLAVQNVDEVAPTITSAATAVAINENVGAGKVVYTATSTDTDVVSGSTVYSLKAGTGDAAAFTINPNTGAVTLTGNPNFEAKASYSFTVVAKDAAGNASEKTVSLAVKDLAESALIITSGATAAAINENVAAGRLVYTTTSTNGAGPTLYSLKAGVGDAAAFAIDPTTGVVTLKGSPNFEAKSAYSFTVVATDTSGNSDEQSVTLAVQNIDEAAPTITSAAAAAAINENAGAGQVVYTATSTDSDVVSGSTVYSLKAGTGDAAAFAINPNTGAVTLTGNPNFEAKASYSFTVVAKDAAGNASEKAVTLSVKNIDEVAPTITSGATATAIDENSGAGKVVYTVTSTDTGDTSTGSTVYSLKAGTGDAAAFTINSNTGAVTLTGNPDFEAKASYNFTVVAKDVAGNAAEKGVSLSINNLAESSPTPPTNPTPPSTPSAPGDVVGFSLQNTGVAEGTGYVTFGQAFAPGAVNPGTPMIAKIGGVDVPVQMDVKTLNADGSVAHAILTLKAPALAANATINGVLAKAASAPSGSVIQAQDLISKGLDLKVEFNIGGTVKTIDAATVLQQAIANGTVETWLKGSQASEYRVTANVSTNLDVTFDIRMDASGKFRTDVVVGRDDAYSTSTGKLNYSVKIMQDGQTKFTDSVSQYGYSNWHEVITSSGAINPHVVHDMQYLINSGALPTYNLQTDISASAINSMLSQVNNSDTGPMGSALIQTYMPAAGGRPDIGPETTWSALYVASQSLAAAKVMFANADASGSAPWHVIDKNGDAIRIDLHPNLWLDGRGTPSNYGPDALPNGFNTGASGWTLDAAHSPSLAYVPYLITGSHYYLDEIAAQASYVIGSFDPNYRMGAQGIIPDEVSQIRDYAWTLRSIGNAAYILPEGDPMKAYFAKLLDNNLSDIIKTHVNGSQGASQGAAEGWLWGQYGTPRMIAPWQQDFVAIALGTMVQQGNAKAATILDWMDNFISGRFINEDGGFHPLYGAAYNLRMFDSSGKPYQTWSEIYAATFGSEVPNDFLNDSYAESPMGYVANAKAALAAVISATQSGDAIEAYGWLQSETTNYLDGFKSDPTWNLSPMLADDKYLTQDEIRVHTGSTGTTMTAANSIEQMLIGGSGNDTIVGGSGINMLFGMAGNDTITAGSGTSYLYGGDGNDRLVDGAGSNTFKGGSGSDVFSFTTANGGDDVIDDFTKGSDRIEIKSNLNGSGITTAAQVVAAATAGADGAVLHFGSHDIVLQGVMLNNLTPDIFTIV